MLNFINVYKLLFHDILNRNIFKYFSESYRFVMVSLAWLTPQSERWRRHVLTKRRLTFNGLHGAIYVKNKKILPLPGLEL
jgi:hypothetical protein